MLSRPRAVTRAVGAAAVVAALCRELDVADLVNSMVRWDRTRWKVSPGTLVCALIINILVSRKPLYKVQPFYKRAHIPGLFDEETTPDDFNDDALARTLSRVAEIDKRALVETVSCRAVSHDEIPVRSVHADTTSISLYGEFEPTEADKHFLGANPGQTLLKITHGHSKQRRPDLKQFHYGLVVTADGLPLTGDVRNGNLSDKTWNREILEGLDAWTPMDLHTIEQEFLNPKELIYVADSALVTPKNLNAIADAQIRFISRLPETYTLADELKDQALAHDDWRDQGRIAAGKKAAAYLSASFTQTLYKRRYRFIVVWSSSLDQRKWKSIQRKITSEKTALAKAAKAIHRRTFNCREDAETELSIFRNENQPTYHQLAVTVTSEEEVRRRPGRPRKGESPPTVTVYRLACRIDEPSEETLTALRAKASMFVMITNLDDQEAWSDGHILREYKNQQHVEGRFRWLKHPLLVDGIFIKSQHRAEALAYVFLLALIIGAYLERRIRHNLESAQKTIEIEGNRTTSRPTIQAILEVLNFLDVLRIETGNETYYTFSDDTPARRFEMIHLAGHDPSIYLRGG